MRGERCIHGVLITRGCSLRFPLPPLISPNLMLRKHVLSTSALLLRTYRSSSKNWRKQSRISTQVKLLQRMTIDTTTTQPRTGPKENILKSRRQAILQRRVSRAGPKEGREAPRALDSCIEVEAHSPSGGCANRTHTSEHLAKTGSPRKGHRGDR